MTKKQRKMFLDVMAAAAVKRVGPNLKNWDRMGVHLSTRLLALPDGATSYNKEERSAVAVLSKGSPVQRPYGTEVLRISTDAVNLSRIKNGGIPLLNSHNQFDISSSLGRVAAAWIEGGALMGKLKFHATEKGIEAEGMVERGEVTGISAGYKVETWEIKTKDGQILDPEMDRIRLDDDLTFTATKWELIECSLVTVPADPLAGVRTSHYDQAYIATGIGHAAAAMSRMRMRMRAAGIDPSASSPAADALARMLMRQRMHERHSAMLAGRSSKTDSRS